MFDIHTAQALANQLPGFEVKSTILCHITDDSHQVILHGLKDQTIIQLDCYDKYQRRHTTRYQLADPDLINKIKAEIVKHQYNNPFLFTKNSVRRESCPA